MQATLKTDWDIPIRLSPTGDRQEGYCVGREKEISRLKSDLLRRNSGAIIVAGHRGVGKTSFVYQAIAEARKQNPKIIPVLMNATQFQNEEDKVLPQLSIENLVRRLYSTGQGITLDSASKAALDKLYKKAVSTIAKSTQKHSNEEIERTETKFSITLEGAEFAAIIIIIAWVLGAWISRISFLPSSTISREAIRLITSLGLPAITVPFLLFKKHRGTSNIQESKASDIYEFDKTIGNLEHDLEAVHRLISSNNDYKLVYVVDELDKLPQLAEKKVLQYFKNLFTLSEAQFIFIGSERFYRLPSSPPEQGELRSQDYTLFSSKYFITRPRFPDLNQYLDTIILRNGISNADLDRIKRALCFEARNDFFDLRERIRVRGSQSLGPRLT